MAARKRAIRHIRRARDIHRQWVLANPKGKEARAMGDRKWHRTWVRRYANVLRVLQKR